MAGGILTGQLITVRKQGTSGLSGLRLSLALAAIAATALIAAPPATGQGRDFHGVVNQGQIHLLGAGAGDFPLMRRAGVGTMRLIVNWEHFAPEGPYHRSGQPLYDWGELDRVIGSAAARGVRVLPFIYKPHTGLGAPSVRRAMVRFTGAMAERYSPRGEYWRGPFGDDFPDAQRRPIRSWQIHNEMNSRKHWGGKPRPLVYARALKLASRAVRRHHRRAEIVLGGLLGAGPGTYRYLRRVYRMNGIRRAFDTVALHPYRTNVNVLSRHIERIRGVMRRHGHGGAGIRLTELGVGSATRPRRPLHKGPRGQARVLRQSFRLLQRNRNRWRIRGVNWFSWQDGSAGCYFCSTAGLVRSDRTLKPSFRAFRRIAR